MTGSDIGVIKNLPKTLTNHKFKSYCPDERVMVEHRRRNDTAATIE